MGINLERRLQLIKEALVKGRSAVLDMTDDELAQVIIGKPKAKASDLTIEQLENIAKGSSNED